MSATSRFAKPIAEPPCWQDASVGGVPVDPRPTPWVFPPADSWPTDDDLIALGADLAPGTLLAAYRAGLFPMPTPMPGEPMGWFSPVCRGVLPLDGLRVSRSMRRSAKRFEIRVDTAFADVVDACGDPRREDGWITPDIRAAYVALHELGWAHSVETWLDDRLVGGLYGVGIGGLFAGESMFHRETDASKVALMGLVDVMTTGSWAGRVLDVQWQTDHLASLGVVEVSREHYLSRVRTAVEMPDPWVSEPPRVG